MKLTEALFQGVAEASCLGIFTTDDQLTITGWNRWLETHSGLSGSEIIGRALLDAFPDLRTRRLERYYRQALSGQMVVLAQGFHGHLLPLPPSVVDSGLTQMPQSARIAPILNEGRVVGTITVIEDVTERFVSESALRSRARQQEAVAGLSQRALTGGVIDALLDEATRTVADVFGVGHCQILTFMPDERSLACRSGWKSGPEDAETLTIGTESLAGYTLLTVQPVIVEDLTAETRFKITPLLRDQGIVSAASVPILSGKEPFGVLAVYKAVRRAFTEEDIRVLQAVANILGFAVERNRLEHELRQRAEDLAQEARRKDEFLAMLAHELRNPLAPIRNAMQIVRLAGAANATVVQASEIVERQVQHMARLVEDLLDVSRISRGRVELRRETIDLASIMIRAVESARPLIDTRNHELTLTQPPQPIWLEGDGTRLVQVVANLLNNAAKYTDAGGKIWLTAERAGNEAILRVRDTGIGIRAELLPRIFDLFVQSDRALDRSDGGLGIGLTLARSLVELHHGKLTASSGGIGLGSEFVVRLPALPGAQPLPAEEPTSQETRRIPPSARRRVLIVDDNVDSAASLAMLLQLQLHDVRVAHDGKAALAEASKSKPEIVFLDIGLPGMNGYAVARELRKQYVREQLMLVAMTGYGQDDDRRRSQQAGFDAHLVKPADLAAILELLERAPSVPLG